jgi:hypothetical protein
VDLRRTLTDADIAAIYERIGPEHAAMIRSLRRDSAQLFRRMGIPPPSEREALLMMLFGYPRQWSGFFAGPPVAAMKQAYEELKAEQDAAAMATEEKSLASYKEPHEARIAQPSPARVPSPDTPPELAEKPEKAPRGPGQSTRAAVRAISLFMQRQGIDPTGDPSLLAREIIDHATKSELPGVELLTLRSMTVLVADAQDGVRRADLPETD